MCEECHEEAIANKIPALHMRHYIETYPCSKHGDPRILSPRLSAWLAFFNVVAPYSTAQTLDHRLIDKFCQEYGIPFAKAFEMLTMILRIVGEADAHQHENRRLPEGEK